MLDDLAILGVESPFGASVVGSLKNGDRLGFPVHIPWIGTCQTGKVPKDAVS